jgi:geranylgeranyl transferase type-2 subunit alpha
MSDLLLKQYPKSYWLWNHRRWVLENCPVPEWRREVEILNKMLTYDPRNFHGWDYRRYVMGQSKISLPREEFEFTTQKIRQNFSNFSAWHYRSKLIPVAFTPKEQAEIISKDLEFVRNAIFTEPRDQSAWLYQRYLLGKGKEHLKLISDYFDIVLLDAKWIGHSKLALAFNQKVKVFI